jgi:hypothetical protein
MFFFMVKITAVKDILVAQNGNNYQGEKFYSTANLQHNDNNYHCKIVPLLYYNIHYHCRSHYSTTCLNCDVIFTTLKGMFIPLTYHKMITIIRVKSLIAPPAYNTIAYVLLHGIDYRSKRYISSTKW